MKSYLGLGIAGNFANHLKQAGEAKDFLNIASDEEDAPKGIFPFYIPNNNGFLGRYCIDNTKLIIPKEYNVQAEPEMALECEMIYENYDDVKVLKNIVPKFFMAFNDASIRNNPNAIKLSQKKNFSVASKGIGDKIPLKLFQSGGICNDYSLTSFLIFDNKAHQYGNNTKLINYSYFNEKLLQWIVKKINTQADFSVLENLADIIKQSNYPEKLIIAVGATSYTPLGEERYLSEDDEICIVVYNHNEYTNEEIKKLLEGGANSITNASIVRQKVLFG